MNFVKCKMCREPFSSFGSKVCPACMEQLDKDFFIIRDYIYDHLDECSVEQVAKGTGVKEKHIVYLLEEDRLSAKGSFGNAYGATAKAALRCQICGRNVNSGQICESCKGTLNKELGAALSAIDDKKSANSAYISPRSSRIDGK
ncbi:MAG: hypothetical protein FWF04_00670 [Clostridiales bacterium]|nr:hypothetical protein [Clostridiales bacterium]